MIGKLNLMDARKNLMLSGKDSEFCQNLHIWLQIVCCKLHLGALILIFSLPAMHCLQCKPCAINMPLLCVQALGDQQDDVVAQALSFLAAITDANLLRRRSLLAILAAKKVANPAPQVLSHGTKSEDSYRAV